MLQEGGLLAKLMAMLFEAANKPEMESVLHAVFPRLLQQSLKLLCDAEVLCSPPSPRFLFGLLILDTYLAAFQMSSIAARI